MKQTRAILMCLWWAWTGIAAGAGGVAEVYAAGNTDLDEFVESIRGVVGREDTVVSDPKQNRVVVVTSSENHQVIAAMAARLQRLPRNVRIDVSFRDLSTNERTSAGVSGRGAVVTRDGDVRSTIQLNPHLTSRHTESSSSTRQSLLVASGREAVLRVGADVPHPEWLESYGARAGRIRQRVAWQDVGSFLAVQPTVLGDSGMIRIRLTPVLTGHAGGRPHQVRFAELATDVTVQDGQTLNLGGLAGDDALYSRFLVGTDQSQSVRKLDIELTPTILGAAGKPAGP